MKLLTTIKKILTEGTVITYDDNIVDLYNKLLNRLLSKKYDWFKKIEINRLTFDKGHHGGQSYLGMSGAIYVDSDWAHKQWRKNYYSAPLNHEDLSFGDIVDIDLSKELQSDIKLIYSVVTNNPTPKYMSFSWIEVIPVKSDDDTLTEETSDRMLRIFDMYMLHNFPNFRKGECVIRKRHPAIGEPQILFYEKSNPDKDPKVIAGYLCDKKELYIDKEMFSYILAAFTKEGLLITLDWFNNEFGFNAKYLYKL